MSHNLNEQQLKVVTYPLLPVIVMAGAGTGKTTILVNRISYLVNNLHINPYRILAITFTNKAASEMNTRIKAEIGKAMTWIGTFHKICIRVLSEEISLLGRNPNFKIVDDEESTVILKTIYDEEKIDKAILSYKNALNTIDAIKNNLYTTEQLYNLDIRKKLKLSDDKVFNIFLKIFERYQQKFDDYNYLDFNDIINFTNKIFDEHDDVRKKWSSRFDYILIDEFQDTNYSQFHLIENLANENFNVFAVGDEDQIIYTFRGANPNIISKFLEHGNEIEILKLEQNYRSTNQILDVANSLISHNVNRVKKNLFSQNSDHIKPIVCNFGSTDQESAFVAHSIKALQNSGVNLKDVAILYRSNYLSRSYEQALISCGIRYNLYGGYKFYQRSEIKDILAYLQVINNSDEMSLRRIINLPRRKISDQVVNLILQYAHQFNISFFDAITRHKQITDLSSAQHIVLDNFLELLNDLRSFDQSNIGNFFDYLVKKIDYYSYIEKQDNKKVESIKNNLEELKQSIINFKNDRAFEWSLSSYLHEIALYTTLDDKRKIENAVTLSTIHSVKGLEYEYVFLVSFNDGIFPSSHSIYPHELEEERRLAYVAITRAKRELYICSNEGFDFNTKSECLPSRFIREIDKDLLDHRRNSWMAIRKNVMDWYDSKNPVKLDKSQIYDKQKENDYLVGDEIVHEVFGLGKIMGIQDDILEILFPPPHNTKRIIYNHKSIKRKMV